MTHGLVLGGGGPVGIAWEIGIAAGLADAGLSLRRAGLVVGTSAGAVAGAQIATGRDPRALYDDHVAMADYTVMEDGSPPPAIDLQPLIGFIMRRPQQGYPGVDYLKEVGGLALKGSAFAEEHFVARIGQLVPSGLPWPDGFVCTAVEAETGSFTVWGKEAEVDLSRAVASSCAVPGVYPTVTIGGQRYMDGGMRSATNCDLARHCDDILVIAVTMPFAADFMAGMVRRELEPLAAAGSRTALIVPDAQALAVFGPDLMDGSRRHPVLEAGRVQGRAEAEHLRATWG